MPIGPEKVAARLSGPLPPVWLIAGSEPLRVEETRDAVFEAAREQGYLERDVIEASGRFNWSELSSSGAETSLFSSLRIIDVRLPGGKPGQDGARAIKEWCAEPPQDTLLVISSGEWDGKISRSAWVGAMDKAGVVVGIWALRPGELPGWIAARMRAAGLAPDKDAIQIMCDRVEGNLLAAAQEIDRLALLKGAGPISAEDVQDSVSNSARFDAFRLLDAVLAGQLQDSLRVAAGLRASDTPIQAIMGAVQFSLQRLLAVRQGLDAGVPEQQVFRKLGIWQAQQAAMRRAAGRLNRERIETAIHDLARIDLQSKGRARGDCWQSFERLVSSLAA